MFKKLFPTYLGQFKRHFKTYIYVMMQTITFCMWLLLVVEIHPQLLYKVALNRRLACRSGCAARMLMGVR